MVFGLKVRIAKMDRTQEEWVIEEEQEVHEAVSSGVRVRLRQKTVNVCVKRGDLSRTISCCGSPRSEGTVYELESTAQADSLMYLVMIANSSVCTWPLVSQEPHGRRRHERAWKLTKVGSATG